MWFPTSGCLLTTHDSRRHSVLNDFTGFAMAALIAWKLIVNKAINKATIVVITKTVQLIFFRYAKSISHLFITHHAMGDAITTDTATNFKKSFERRATIPETLAPKTLRTPISFIRCSALNVASPN